MACQERGCSGRHFNGNPTNPSQGNGDCHHHRRGNGIMGSFDWAIRKIRPCAWLPKINRRIASRLGKNIEAVRLSENSCPNGKDVMKYPFEKFLPQARKILDEHKAQYKGVYYMKGGFLGQVLNNPLTQIVADVAATATGNPELIPIINGGLHVAGGLDTGQGIGNSLRSGAEAGALSFGGQQLGGLAGNLFPETFGNAAAAGAGGNNLFQTDTGLGSLFGNELGYSAPTAGAGADLFSNLGISGLGSNIANGASSLGNDITSGLSDAGSAVSQGLGFGNSNAATGEGLTGDFTNAAYAPSSAASSAPGSVSSGFTPTASTGGSLGGGTSGGFFQDAGSNLGAGNAGGGFLDTGNDAAFNAVQPANGSFLDSSALNGPIGAPAAATTAQTSFDNAGSQLLGSKGVDLSSIVGGGGNGSSNAVNGVLRSGLSSLFTQNPYKGSPQIANTLNQSAQQYSPFVQGGTQAEGALSNLFGLNGQAAADSAQQNWQNTPGYQFQLAQGTGALQNSAAASGGLLNGNTGEALVNYGQGLAGTTYQNYINNLQNQVGQGQTALGSQSSLQGQAAQLNQQPGQFNANQKNQGIGGILASLFPSQSGNSGLSSLFA